VKKAVFTR